MIRQHPDHTGDSENRHGLAGFPSGPESPAQTRHVIRVRLMCAYSDWPLWDDQGSTSPEDWPQLTRRLVADLVAWQSFHERHIAGRDRWTGPHHLLTGTRRAARRWFDEEGSRLRRRLQAELGRGYLVDLRL